VVTTKTLTWGRPTPALFLLQFLPLPSVLLRSLEPSVTRESLSYVALVHTIITVFIGVVFAIWLFFFRTSGSGVWDSLWLPLVAGGFVTMSLNIAGLLIANFAIHLFIRAMFVICLPALQIP